MNTANLQLEGLYLAIACLNNALVSKGLLTREEVNGALACAEQTAIGDYLLGELRPANRDAVAFPIRLLMLANNSSSGAGVPPFSELARMVGLTKDLRDEGR